jgi:hypothetical protein
MNDNTTPRALSHDEKHAAEAAFAGRPFNSRWSARARLVYDGIVKSLPTLPAIEEETTSMLSESTPDSVESIPAEAAARTVPYTDDSSREGMPPHIPFQRAIDSGALIDVTSAAKQLGLAFSVTVTKPLWDTGIAPVQTLTQEEQAVRLRDVLMAFRLRLTTQPSLSPLIDFPALLAIPPSTVPQPIPLFALIQPDEENRAMATLLLPNEVATTIIPQN